MNVMEHSDQCCPECGGPSVDGLDCWWQMGAVCAWEWQDPELAALHFVTVASTNLQHPAKFTEEAIAELKQIFIAHFDKGMPIAEIRRRIGDYAAGNTTVRRKESERKPVLRRWSMTIADVYLPDQPQGAANRVRKWAAAIRREVEEHADQKQLHPDPSHT